MEPVKVFYSYSHKDKILRDELGNHLTSLKTDGTCVDWYDGEIQLGSVWDAEIKAKLDAADFILLLISADFLASGYSRSVELTRAVERQERNEARIVPILLRPVLFSGEVYSKFQGLPPGMRAVTSWPDQDEAFFEIVKALQHNFEAFRQERAAAAAPGAGLPPPPAPAPVPAPAPISPVAAPNVVAATPAAPLRPPDAAAQGLPPGEPLSDTQEKNRILASTSKEGFVSLGKLMANEKIKAFVAEQATELVAADEALEILFDYKNVHDQLHNLQFLCYNYLFQERRKAEEQIDWRLLVKPAAELDQIIEALRAASTQPALADEEFSWLDDLQEAQAQFKTARDELSLPPLILAAQAMKTILEMRPVIFDTKLCATARSLPLEDLMSALFTIRGKLSPAALASEMGVKFSAGVEALPALSQSLQALTAEHTKWQAIATTLWSINALIDENLEALRKSWDRLRDRLLKICGGNPSPWAVSLAQEAAKLDALLKEPMPDDPKEKRKWQSRVLQSYESCSSEGETRFFQVDVSLLALCAQLRGMHTALAAILQELP